jgi:hypothetical protein
MKIDNCDTKGPTEIKKDSDIIPEKDSMGREKFWEDAGRPNE